MDHSFNPVFAVRYGMVAAVLMHDFAYWTAKNRANGKHMHDGLCWTYNSASAFKELYPYMSKNQIYAALKKMMDEGLIVKGDYNTDKWKHTPWYAITEKGYSIIAECATMSEEHRNDRHSENQTVECPDFEQSSFENRDDDVANSERRRPENATSITNNNNNNPSAYISYTNTENHLTTPERACEEEIPNPFSDDTGARPRTETVQAYVREELHSLGINAMEELHSFMEDLPDDVIKHAVDIARDNNVRRWSYVRSILNRYVDADVRTLADVEALDDEIRHRSQRASPASRPSRGSSFRDEIKPLGNELYI